MILDQIIKHTQKRVEMLAQIKSYDEVKNQAQAIITSPPFAFEKALRQEGMAFICEVKKASPSKGVISSDFPYLDIAKEYEAGGASAISVLTEPEFFKGDDRFLREIKKTVSVPLLRKDFTVSKYQIYEAKTIGADAILLICSVLDTKTLARFIETADSLGLSSLVEAHTEDEVLSALAAGARIVGVNNRNLSTFEVDLENSLRLRHLVPDDILFVSESGIKTKEDILKLEAGRVDAVLIGETLMKSGDKAAAVAKLKRGVAR